MKKKYIDFAETDRQKEIAKALDTYANNADVSRQLGIDPSMVSRYRSMLEARATRSGYSEHFIARDKSTVSSEGLAVSRTTTLHKSEDPERPLQWVRNNIKLAEQISAVEAFVEVLNQGVKPAKPRKLRKSTDDRLLTCIPIGDPHFGMYAWGREVGEDFNLEVAEQRTVDGMSYLIDKSPASDTCLIIELGDMLHADDSSNQTFASKHTLDVDTRYGKVCEVAQRAMVRSIEYARAKFKKVVVWIVPGNHDPHSSLWLAKVLHAYYRNYPEVEVKVQYSWYYYMLFGKVLIGAHHGHGAKIMDLPKVMASDVPKLWGDSEHRYMYMGHIHHKELRGKSDFGVHVESFETLAGPDAWHHGKGYRSKQSITAIVHDIEDGEDERYTCSVSKLKRLYL